MNPIFPTDYHSILDKIDLIDPIQYGQTRNYVNGSVTYLSPYISRGVISTKQVLEKLFEKGYKKEAIESLIKELCWRDYFQRVGQCKDLQDDIRQKQDKYVHNEMPIGILEASAGIEGIDHAIEQLYQTGYMHNHCRMYTASLVCNIAQTHWYQPSRWMYYHLLDGDWASNACSWQWVAGANSHKKYYANQENINKYTHTNQTDTFLDLSYEEIDKIEIPNSLVQTRNFSPEIFLPEATALSIIDSAPTFIYNYYNLDPLWHKGELGNRILLIDPAFFTLYPISKLCLEFMLNLSKNIPGIQVYIGSFESFVQEYPNLPIYYKEHPLNKAYTGMEESRDWIAPDVTGYYPSFFAYWKKVEKQI
ncbi:MAG: hypothetical protein KA797_01960 [Chitinophagales bacterium]|nr:hypothetical protein [Chitinophagales bacterium]